jgi:hypothetical protein
MGYQETTKVTKTGNARHVEKPEQVFLEIYGVLSGPHIFHKEPGWDPKGQPKEQKMKMSDMQKTLSKFLLKSVRSYQNTTFSTRIQDGIPRDNKPDKKGNA